MVDLTVVKDLMFFKASPRLYSRTQLFHDSATVCHCLTSFRVNIQLDHFCIGDGSYIEEKIYIKNIYIYMMVISLFGPNLGYSQNTRDDQG